MWSLREKKIGIYLECIFRWYVRSVISTSRSMGQQSKRRKRQRLAYHSPKKSLLNRTIVNVNSRSKKLYRSKTKNTWKVTDQRVSNNIKNLHEQFDESESDHAKSECRGVVQTKLLKLLRNLAKQPMFLGKCVGDVQLYISRSCFHVFIFIAFTSTKTD